MFSQNNSPRKAVIILALLLLPALLLLYAGYTLPRQMHGLQQELQGRVKYHELLTDIYNMNTSAQEYLLYGDAQALNNFRYYSGEAVKKEMELYNTEKQARKQDVAELITLHKAYNSFVEREIVPGLKPGTADNREVLLWQHRDFSHQLVNRAQALTESGRQENKAALQYMVTLLNKQGFFMLLLAMLSLGASLYGLVAVWPWLVRYLCLESQVRGTPNAVMMIDRKERLLDLNPAAEKLFNLPLKAVAGKSMGEISILYPHLQNLVQPLRDALLNNEKISDYKFNFAGGLNKILLAVDCTPVYLLKKPAGAFMMARETTKSKDGSILLETIEMERKRLSIEIHDWIGRYMSSIIHSLDYILRLNGTRLPAEVQENLVLLRAHCQNAAIDMRSIMHDLHPYLIEKVGLIPALESYSGNFERVHNKKVYIFYSQRSLRLDREEEILIYRIIQEALTNVARHSAATEVDIHFTDTRDTLKIEIIDNGGLRDTAPAPGKGLWGMKERAGLIGGDLVYGFQDGGFNITLTLPRTASEGEEVDG